MGAAGAGLWSWLGSTVFSVGGVSVTWGQLIVAVATVSYSAAQQRKMKKRLASLAEQGRTITFQEPAAPRSIIYGTAKVGGNRVFAHVTGVENEYMHMIVAHAGHEVDAISTLYFGDDVVTVDGSGNATGFYAGVMRVKTYLGTDTQSVGSGTLTTDAPGVWTSNHRMRGIACTEWRLKWDADKFPNGLLNTAALIRGKKLYDPRDGSTAFSANPALAVRDYLTSPVYGFGAGDDEIDDATIIAAANICDETVLLADGVTTESRYTCNGVLDTAVSPGDNLADLLSSMAGWAVYSGGKWRVYAGAHQSAAATFGVDDLRGPVSVQTAASRRDACNAVKGIYVSAVNNWQPADFPPVRNGMYEVEDGSISRTLTVDTASDVVTLSAAANLTSAHALALTTTGALPAPLATGTTYYWIPVSATTGKLASSRANALAGTALDLTDAGMGTHTARFGEVLWNDLELPYTTSSATAQRIAKIELERSRQDIVVTLPLKLCGLKVRAGSTVALALPRYGWSGKLFQVAEWTYESYQADGDAPALGTRLTLRETASGIYDWSNGEETAVDLAPDTTLPDPWTVATPTDLTLTSGSATLIIQPDGTIVPRLLASWTTPADQLVLSGGQIRVQYRPSGIGAAWLDWAVLAGDSTSDYITNVATGVAYDVRIRGENTLGVSSSWVESTGHAVLADTTGPSTPTGLVAVVGTGKVVSLDWNDNTEADLSEYVVRRATTPIYDDAVKIAEVRASRFVDVDVSLGTTYYYWLQAVDRSENGSPSTFSVSATPSVIVAGSTDPNAPANPSAPTLDTSSTYQSGDGTVFARLVLDMPPMPTGAAWMNLLYRRSGSTGWIVADQRNTGGGTSSIDDLSPAVQYDVGIQAFSAFGVGSAIVVASGSPFTAPAKSGTPTTPTNVTLSSDGVIPRFLSGTAAYMFGTRISWDPIPDTDLSHYEVKVTFTNSDSAVDYTWGPGHPLKTREVACGMYNALLQPGYVRVRSVDLSGNASPWVLAGNANSAATIGTGSISKYDSDDVETSGIRTGATSASSVRKVLARYQDNVVQVLSGGSATEYFAVSLSNRGFSTKPDVGVAQCTNNAAMLAAYDWDHVSNSSTQAMIRVRMVDGSNVPSAAQRFSIELIEYD